MRCYDIHRHNDDGENFYLGSVLSDEDPGSNSSETMDEIQDLWITYTEEQEDPEGDCANFVNWLIENHGFSEPTSSVVVVVVG